VIVFCGGARSTGAQRASWRGVRGGVLDAPVGLRVVM
jgi:hypothetical protein